MSQLDARGIPRRFVDAIRTAAKKLNSSCKRSSRTELVSRKRQEAFNGSENSTSGTNQSPAGAYIECLLVG